MHDSVGRSVRSAGRLGGNSVRGSVTGDVVSGPVSEISVRGAMAGPPVTGGGSVGQASVGAVKKDVASPLGEMISEPLRELGPLQDQLRAIQPLRRDDASPDEAAEPAEAAPDTQDTAATTPEQEPAEETEAAEDTGEPPTLATDEQPEDEAQDASDEPASTPTEGEHSNEP